MKPVELVVLGGCHVAGYPIGPDQAFPALLSGLVDGEVVGQVPYLQFVDLPRHLPAVAALQPSHVVLQLGNHEFSASLRAVAHQFRRAFGPPPAPKAAKPAKPAEAGAAAAEGPAAPASAAGPLAAAGFAGRVLVVGLLTAVLWRCSARHRRAVGALNACMRQHPGTAFVFLSPFPCLAPADNALRRFGGWVLRGRLARLPNVHWLDSHRLLRPARHLFVDASHLNKYAHRALAYGLAAAFFGNIDGLL